MILPKKSSIINAWPLAFGKILTHRKFAFQVRYCLKNIVNHNKLLVIGQQI
jgi:hypothetical protein